MYTGKRPGCSSSDPGSKDRTMKHGISEPDNAAPPELSRNQNFVVILYFLHLAPAALLLVDILAARLRRQITLEPASFDAGVAMVSAVWLVAGFAFFFLSRNRSVFIQKVSVPLLTIYTVYLTLGAAEVCVRLTGFTAPIINWRMTKAVTRMDPAVFPGVSGAKIFTINRLGLRGPMPPKPGEAYRILAIGGSTTICANLDDSEEWPHKLMEYVNASQNRSPVWVGNAGAAGANSVNHAFVMEWFPGRLRVDMVVFLVGVNDMVPSLALGGAPTQAVLEKQAGFHGDLPPGTLWRSVYPFYRRSRLLLLVRESVRNLGQRLSGATELPLLNPDKFRKRRAASPVVPLPDLSTGLKEYRNRIARLASQCRNLDLRCLFLTQPSMWRDDLRADEQRLLWSGYAGPWEKPTGYFSAGDMAKAMEMYNRTLLDFCRQSGLECYDLASHIPKDTSAFFDEVHFNEAGARLVAQNLKQYLLSRPPFHAQDKQTEGAPNR